MGALPVHHPAGPHHVSDCALVKDRHQQGSVIGQESLLSTEPRGHSLFEQIPGIDLREQRPRILLRLE